MENLFKSLKESKYDKLEIEEVLYVEYTCLSPNSELEYGFSNQYWTPRNYFVYVINGNKKWSTQNNGYLLGKEQCLFIKKGAFASHNFYEEEPFEALIVALDDNFIANTLKCIAPTSPVRRNHEASDTIIRVDVDASISAYFISLLSYFSSTAKPTKELLHMKFKELIVRLLNQSNNAQLSDYFLQLCSRQEISIREVMEHNFLFDLSLNEFAHLSKRSLSRFQRDFRKIYGQTPGKWLVQQRLKHARWLLEHTDMDIAHVVWESGFKNVSHFIKIFKNQYGTTPGKCRNVTNAAADMILTV